METEVNINENRPPVNNTKKLELDKENFDITQRFGKYLSEQYEVLERTLSYLNIDDLISASQVSTSWKKVTECLLKKRRRAAKVRWHIQHKPIIPNHYFKKHINFEIQFVLGIGFELKNTKNIVLNQLLEDKSYICSSTREDVRNGRNIPGLLDANMIFVKTWGNDIPYYVEDKLNYSRNLPAAILFPKMNGVRIFIVPIKNNEFEFCPASLKGILLLNRKSRFNALERALLSIEGDAEESIVVGGGMFEHIQRFCQNRGKLGRCEDLSICFCGENVSCHSEVLYFDELNHTEEFLIKMKNTIGPFDPRKQQRMAFIIRCVTRSNGEYENNLFKKHFPDVPAFMLLSLGEYGRDYEKSFEDDSPAVKKRRHRVLVQYAYSVVYFFVTFNLSQ